MSKRSRLVEPLTSPLGLLTFWMWLQAPPGSHLSASVYPWERSSPFTFHRMPGLDACHVQAEIAWLMPLSWHQAELTSYAGEKSMMEEATVGTMQPW